MSIKIKPSLLFKPTLLVIGLIVISLQITQHKIINESPVPIITVKKEIHVSGPKEIKNIEKNLIENLPGFFEIEGQNDRILFIDKKQCSTRQVIDKFIEIRKESLELFRGIAIITNEETGEINPLGVMTLWINTEERTWTLELNFPNGVSCISAVGVLPTLTREARLGG